MYTTSRYFALEEQAVKRAVILILWALALGVTACEGKSYEKETSELTGGWEFRRAGDELWRTATVPGCVHTDLLNNGLIGDPFYRMNEGALRWIEEADWEYRTSFYVRREVANRDNLELYLEGLDTYADVYLNDSLMLSANNMFRGWRVDCKNVIREGENDLRVYFHSPVMAQRRIQEASRYELPGGGKVFTRKAGYHYGWDWGPRLVTSGIWRPVYLTAWNGARITSLRIVQKSVTEEMAELAAVFEIESGVEQRASVSISAQGGIVGPASRDVVLRMGINVAELEFAIADPKLWWTNGLGEPHLYELIGVLRMRGRTIDRVRERIGIRTLALVTGKDAQGESFFFMLNGVPVFVKGANYIPQDSFLPLVTRERYESVINSAADAGMNMLRVWGGGVYERDCFYYLCDERGILVWQDFMFACAMYPGDERFLDNVRREAIEAVKRLRSHPCIALWCGNNEVDEGWHNWGWQNAFGYSKEERAEIWNSYETLFHELLPGIVETYDGGRPYWPSSPKYGRADPLSLREGDSHYWGIWHDEEPFEVFEERVPRFMSEFGFQSFPGFETVKRFTIPGDRNLESEVMRSHQKHPRGNRLIQNYMDRYYRTPKDFESFIYVSQLLQALAITTGIEAHRRGRPYCMGTLYWQLNDCWPVASWSSIDYYGNWKALHYFVKKAYRNVLASARRDGDTVSVHIVSDLPRPVDGELQLKLVDFTGEMLWHEELKVHVPSGSSKSYVRIGSKELLRGGTRNKLVLCAELRREEALLSRSLLYFVPPKDLDLTEPVIVKTLLPTEIRHRTELSPGLSGKKRYRIELSADVLVKNCYLTLEGIDGFFTNNYFDILPGDTVKVELITKERIDNLEGKIRTMSLVDTY